MEQHVSLYVAGTPFTTEVRIEQLYYELRLRWKVRQRPDEEFLTFCIWRQNTSLRSSSPVQLQWYMKTQLHLSVAAKEAQQR
jgi:DNA mismatch repair ATPase MutL